MAEKKVLSIEIGLNKIRICELDYMKKNPHIYKCFTFDIPVGCIEDGYIKEQNTISKIINRKLDEEGIKNRRVIFTIASSKIANREVVIPFVKSHLINNIIQANAMDYFPVDVTEYTLSHTIMEKINNKEEKKLRLLLLAAPNYLIKNYYEFAALMNFEVVALDYAGNSTFQLMKKQVSEGVSLVVQISEKTTLINIIDNEILILQRTIPYGTSSVIDTIIKSEYLNFKTEKEAIEHLLRDDLINANFNLSAEEAGMSMADNHESYDKIIKELKGKEEVTNSLKYIISNVNRVVDYYNSKFTDKKIGLVYLSGEGGKFRGIEYLFHNEVGIELRKFEKLFSVIFGNRANVTMNSQSDYLTCIGASIDPVHFVLKEYALKQQRKSSAINMAGIFTLCVFASVVIGGIAIISYAGAKRENKKLNAEIERLQSVEDLFLEYDQVKLNYETISGMNSQTVNRNQELNEFIEELQLKMPTNVMANSMTANGDGIAFNMTATSKEAVAKLLLELKTFKSISNVSIGGIAEEEDENGLVSVTFAVSCTYLPMVAEQEVSNEE